MVDPELHACILPILILHSAPWVKASYQSDSVPQYSVLIVYSHGIIDFDRLLVQAASTTRLRGLGMLESELFAFLEGTTDAAFSVSEQGEIRSWNGAAQRLFGYPFPRFLARAVSRYCTDGEFSGQKCAMRAAAF